MKEYRLLHGALIAPQDVKEICDMIDAGTINRGGTRVICDELYMQGRKMYEALKIEGVVQ